MPHTNRARRAQHFRSIDNSVGQSDGNIVNAPTKRTAKPLARGGDLSNDAPEAGLVGEGGPGSGGVGHQRKAANVKGGKKAPSAKNRIRSLTRLLNKPVRVIGWPRGLIIGSIFMRACDFGSHQFRFGRHR